MVMTKSNYSKGPLSAPSVSKPPMAGKAAIAPMAGKVAMVGKGVGAPDMEKVAGAKMAGKAEVSKPRA